MSSMIKLQPEELFFLGEIMQAEYIDYSYIEAMGDIQARFAVIKKEAIASLGEKGLVKESISGRLRVRPLAEELCGPIFFGPKETVAVVFRNGKRQEAYTKFFHFKEEDITCVTMENGILKIEKTDLKEIEDYANTLFDTAASNPSEISKMNFHDVTDIIKIKSGVVRVGAKSKTWCISDGVLFGGDCDDDPVVVRVEQAKTDAVRLLKGE